MIRKYILIALTSISLASVAQAQEAAPLVTDRPDATEAPTVVPVGSLQVETGGLYSSFDDGVTKQESLVYNTTLLRYGIFENLELRVGWNLQEDTASDLATNVSSQISGLSPLLLGLKVAIVEEQGWRPEIGLIGHVFLPVSASEDFKPEFTSSDFRLAFNHTLSERSGLAYNLGAQWGDDSPEASFIYTIAYGYSFADRLGAYVELYGDLPEKNSANHLWDAGLTYMVTPLVQLDATVGTSITSGQDILVSAGVSFRIDKKK